MFCARINGSRRLSLWISVVALLTIPVAVTPPQLSAQSNDIGNGGGHAIQGRLYITNGRRSEIPGLRIRLTSPASGDMSIISDETGAFIFRGLNAGSYQVIVDGGTAFEDATESVVIDDPGSTNIRMTVRMRSLPRIINVQVYLKPKAGAASATAVINAKWASVSKGAVESYERGLRLVQEGNDRDAEVAFRRSIEIAPSFAPAHTALGRLSQRTGKLDAAIESWKTAIRYDAEDFDAQLNLGIAFLNLKKYADAEPPLVNAAFLEPSAVTPHYYIGIAYVMRNDLEVAMKAFEKAKELNGGKNLPAIHKYLGRIYGAKNKHKEAVQELETYLKLAPNAQDVEKVRKDIADIKTKQN